MVMTDDPNRARCSRCFCWMSKEREQVGVCGFCERSPTGIWRPTPIAPHRYRAKGGKTELMREEEEE